MLLVANELCLSVCLSVCLFVSVCLYRYEAFSGLWLRKVTIAKEWCSIWHEILCHIAESARVALVTGRASPNVPFQME